jgi:hypothetical protein
MRQRWLVGRELGHLPGYPNLATKTRTIMSNILDGFMHSQHPSLSILAIVLAMSTACRVEDTGAQVGALRDVAALALPEPPLPQLDWSVDGKTLAVSTATEGTWFETVRIFGLSDTGTWEEQAWMELADPGDARGFDVTLSDDGDIVTLSPHVHGPGARPMYVYRRDATNTWLHQANIGDPVYFERALELGIQHHEAAAYYDTSEQE